MSSAQTLLAAGPDAGSQPQVTLSRSRSSRPRPDSSVVRAWRCTGTPIRSGTVSQTSSRRRLRSESSLAHSRWRRPESSQRGRPSGPVATATAFVASSLSRSSVSSWNGVRPQARRASAAKERTSRGAVGTAPSGPRLASNGQPAWLEACGSTAPAPAAETLSGPGMAGSWVPSELRWARWGVPSGGSALSRSAIRASSLMSSGLCCGDSRSLLAAGRAASQPSIPRPAGEESWPEIDRPSAPTAAGVQRQPPPARRRGPVRACLSSGLPPAALSADAADGAVPIRGWLGLAPRRTVCRGGTRIRRGTSGGA